MAPGNVTPFDREDETVPESEQIVMKCCQKTHEFMRDCDCAVPQGPCMAPRLYFTHYRPDCFCFSCKWLRETKSREIASRIPGESSRMVPNPTFGRNEDDTVLETKPRTPCTNLELVYPVLWEENQNEWKWVFRPVDDKQLSFLAPPDQSSGVWSVTLNSQGQWKALYANDSCYPLGYDTRPGWNELYDDYGYARTYSPYGPMGDSEFKSTPDEVNPEGYKAPRPPNKSREHSAMPKNTTLFIGGINKRVADEKLKELFQQFGQITYVNRPHQTSGFVQYAVRRDALMAMRQMQGVPIYNCRLRISWGNPKVKNQCNIPEKAGERPFKGNKHHHHQQPQSVPQQMFQGFNDMPWPQDQQQQYYMPRMSQGFDNMPWPQYQQQQYYMPQWVYAPVPNGGFWYQDPYQQQMGYSYPHMAQPPPPPPPSSITPSSQPDSPQSIQSSYASSLNPSAASWKGNLKREGPLVVSSDMVPNPSQESHDQTAPRSNSATPLESNQQANASSEDGNLMRQWSNTMPNPEQESYGQSSPRSNSATPLESNQENASSEDGSLVIQRSNTMPNPEQESHGQSIPRSKSAPPRESNEANASSEDGKSSKTIMKASPGDDNKPAGDSKAVLANGQVYNKLEGADESSWAGWYVNGSSSPQNSEN